MNRKRSNQILLIAILLILLVFTVVAVKAGQSAYQKKVAAENISEPDFYSMAQFSDKNSKEVMKALKSGNSKKLGELLTDPQGAEDVAGFANWGDADFDNAVSMGAGSNSVAPDKKGMIDISERYIVTAGDQKYVLYIETLTSRHGMENEGVSVIAATTYEHFEETYLGWNGEKDEKSVVAGKSFVKE